MCREGAGLGREGDRRVWLLLHNAAITRLVHVAHIAGAFPPACVVPPGSQVPFPSLHVPCPLLSVSAGMSWPS